MQPCAQWCGTTRYFLPSGGKPLIEAQRSVCTLLFVEKECKSAAVSYSCLIHLQGYLPFTWVNRKFQLEDQMVCAIPFGKLQKIWALICGDAIFLLFYVSLADVDRLFCNSLSRNIAFKCLIFMPEISNRMVFVNGEHPWLPILVWFELRCCISNTMSLKNDISIVSARAHFLLNVPKIVEGCVCRPVRPNKIKYTYLPARLIVQLSGCRLPD